MTQVFSGDALGARVDGEAGNDALYGGDSDDILQGGDGNDFVRGGGDDTVVGGDGDDTLIGGEGRDILAVRTPISRSSAGTSRTHGDGRGRRPDGDDSAGDADTLYGIETLRFDDGDYAIGDDGTTRP